MNREALRHHFENEFDGAFEELDKGFLLKASVLENETLAEIAACDAVIKDDDMPCKFWVMPSPGDPWYRQNH